MKYISQFLQALSNIINHYTVLNFSYTNKKDDLCILGQGKGFPTLKHTLELWEDIFWFDRSIRSSFDSDHLLSLEQTRLRVAVNETSFEYLKKHRVDANDGDK